MPYSHDNLVWLLYARWFLQCYDSHLTSLLLESNKRVVSEKTNKRSERHNPSSSLHQNKTSFVAPFSVSSSFPSCGWRRKHKQIRFPIEKEIYKQKCLRENWTWNCWSFFSRRKAANSDQNSYLFSSPADLPFASRLQAVLHEMLNFFAFGNNTVLNGFWIHAFHHKQRELWSFRGLLWRLWNNRNLTCSTRFIFKW